MDLTLPSLARLAFLLLLASFPVYGVDVKVVEIGILGQRYSQLVPVTFRLSNPDDSVFKGHLRVDLAGSPRGYFSQAFSVPVQLQPRHQEERQIPLLIGPSGALRASIVDLSDKVHYTTETNLPDRSELGVILLCAAPAECEAAQQSITFTGTLSEKAAKNDKLRFLHLYRPLEHYWSYSGAEVVVVLRAIPTLTVGQRLALADFARAGGMLVIVGNETTALEPYRIAPKVLAGAGRVWRVRSTGVALGEVFTGKTLAPLVEGSSEGFAYGPWGEPWWAKEAYTRFEFPSFLSLLSWLLLYLLLVGIVNFSLLRRFGRLEWGWYTVAGISLLFVAILFIVGGKGKPAHWVVDEVTMYQMDDQSPVAFATSKPRVTAPNRGSATLSIAQNPIPTSIPELDIATGAAELFYSITDRSKTRPQPPVVLGATFAAELQLAKWSFRSLTVQSFERLPGTVHWIGPGRLRNDTGLHFAEALFFDPAGERVVHFTDVAQGQEIDIASGKHLPWEPPSSRVDKAAKPRLSLEKEYLAHNLAREPHSYVIAYSRQSAARAKLSQRDTLYSRVTFVKVALNQP